MDWGTLLQATAPERVLGLDTITFGILFGLLTLFVGSVVSWFVSRYYYQRGRDKHRLIWTNFTATAADTFTTRNPKTVLTYAGEPVSNVSVSWLVFWNNGVETVRRDDLVQDDPIRIEPSSGNQILAVQIVAQNNSPSKLEIVTNPSNAAPAIEFDFLRPSNGAVFQVTHSGRSPSAIQLVGALKTDPQPQHVELPTNRFRALPPTARASVQEMPGTGWIPFLITVVTLISAIGGGGIILSVLSGSLGEPWVFVFLLIWLVVALIGSLRLMYMLDQRVGPTIPAGLQVLADDGESTTEYWDRRLPPERRSPLA